MEPFYFKSKIHFGIGILQVEHRYICIVCGHSESKSHKSVRKLCSECGSEWFHGIAGEYIVAIWYKPWTWFDRIWAIHNID